MKSFLLPLLILLNSSFLFSQTITVGTTGDFPNLEAAESSIAAGTTVILQSQTFSDGTQFLNDLAGTAQNPIVIQAEIEHQTIFQGGTEAIHLVNCNYVEINGLIIQQQTGNGINIDDGGDYSTPSTNIIIKNCIFRDMAASGNNDLLKMSGVDDFLIQNCQFLDGGAGGSGVDFVGCHSGTVEDCLFDNAGTTGIQAKGGSQFIRIQRNLFKNISQRALNLGGSTGLQFFRPPLPNPIENAFEAADLEVFSNIFIGNWAPIAYVGSVRVKVYNNTIYQPDNWVIRILQETTADGFLPCSDNEFRNNIVYLESDLTEVNIGSNTEPSTFSFSNNLWFNESSNSWSPNLPVMDENQIIANPLFMDANNDDFKLNGMSPAIGEGLMVDAPTSDYEQLLYNNPPSIGAHEANPATSLATTIHDFRGFVENGMVHLFWKVNGFSNGIPLAEVEHSTDYLNWQKLGFISNEAAINQYEFHFLHTQPSQGSNYYRLKIGETTEQFFYSSIVYIEVDEKDIFEVFPNPFSKVVWIRGLEDKTTKILIINNLGTIVKVFNEGQLKYDLSGLAEGVYWVIVKDEDGQVIGKKAIVKK